MHYTLRLTRLIFLINKLLLCVYNSTIEYNMHYALRLTRLILLINKLVLCVQNSTIHGVCVYLTSNFWL